MLDVVLITLGDVILWKEKLICWQRRAVQDEMVSVRS